MFSELNVLLKWDVSSLPKGKCVIIQESDADGSFLMHHFLSSYLRGGFSVCFLALAQTFSHYSAVAQRLGLDLNAAKESGQLHFIDGLGCSLELMHDGKGCNEQQNPLIATRMKDGTTKELFCQIKETLSSSVNGDSDTSLLLIDDLSLLVSLGLKPIQVDQLVHYCMATLPSTTLVALTHNDTSVEDEEYTTLATHLRHRADIVLVVEGLSSGYCKDVHGQLSITNRMSDDAISGRRQHKAFHYKVLDKTVNFFPIGTSAAVL